MPTPAQFRREQMTARRLSAPVIVLLYAVEGLRLRELVVAADAAAVEDGGRHAICSV